MASLANAAKPSARQLEIIRRLALREAARRQEDEDARQQAAATAAAAAAAVALEASGSDGMIQDEIEPPPKDSSLLPFAELESLLDEERNKNNVAWSKVQEHEEILTGKASQSEPQGGSSSSMHVKQLELARLDYDIARLAKDLPKLDEAQSDTILALLTRSTLASAIEQYEAGIRTLRADLIAQRGKLQNDEDLLRDLNEVRIGLEKRRDVLRRRRDTVGTVSVERKLVARLEKSETDLHSLLQNLIEISEQIFEDPEGVQQAQLRHLIDRLINKAWDTPADPYVNVVDDYLPSIPAFLLRANIANEHPRDTRRLRLIEFHRAAAG